MNWVQRGGSIGRNCVKVNANQVTYNSVNNLGTVVKLSLKSCPVQTVIIWFTMWREVSF